ncbi:ATP-binding cassette domain-containing protein [Cryptosporangium aurantiacum]|uniref:ABC-2 type transport system ATP-binding protein n=1 Tax=Cryptosporangium aurantiacum TaxID=134849 RepID=A0A1M7KZ16_9ACTN|nr:ATP-binding cassette domain-containing protein [Cryptosporangium aurantiacum]SHM70731.1 ABC-2 type transport system ATP-binding protein [Cryptosporangium aurantiacum]
MSGALVAEGLHYRYSRRGPDVLRGLDWAVAPATRTVLLGPEKSGKSTLLRLLAHVDRPRSGRVYLTEGGDARRIVGWLPQKPPWLSGLTVRDQVAYVGWLKGLSKSDAAARATDCLGHVGLADAAGQLTQGLKPWQRSRLALAEGLVHDARFLILDEPTAELEPPDRAKFWNVVRRLSRDLAVVVSTSDTREAAVEGIDRVAVLSGGAFRFAGARDAFLQLAPAAAPIPRNRKLDATERAAWAAYWSLLGEEAR